MPDADKKGEKKVREPKDHEGKRSVGCSYRVYIDDDDNKRRGWWIKLERVSCLGR
jgi:hypothetical protein